MLQESLALLRELDDSESVGVVLRNLGDLARDRAEYREATAAYEESLSLARQRGDSHEIAYALRGLGHVARIQGEYARAGQLLRDSLSLLAELRDRRCIPLCLEGLACIATGPGWAERATRLLGAAHAIQQTTGAPPPPSEMADYRRTEADARAQLGEQRFATVRTHGAAMSLEQAIAYALAEHDLPGTAVGSPVVAPQDSPARTRVELPQGVPLSAREREVVALIAAGLSNREISERLVLSVRTVERHIENVYNRLGIHGKAGRAIVTAYALRHHLIEPA
jgi:ATP/maltotriose-dependent transcriptional regulator MalT